MADWFIVIPEPFFVMAGPFFVMVGLGPAIHDFGLRRAKSWMPAPDFQAKNLGGHDDGEGGLGRGRA
jgi:hypothetical protein